MELNFLLLFQTLLILGITSIIILKTFLVRFFLDSAVDYKFNKGLHRSTQRA